MLKFYRIVVVRNSTTTNGLRKGMHVEYLTEYNNPFYQPKDQYAIAEKFATEYKIKVSHTEITKSLLDYEQIS